MDGGGGGGGSTSWTQQTKLLASDGDSGDHFGFGVGLQGDVLLVGSPGDYTDLTWPSSTAAITDFGLSRNATGDFGEPRPLTVFAGSAYLF